MLSRAKMKTKIAYVEYATERQDVGFTAELPATDSKHSTQQQLQRGNINMMVNSDVRGASSWDKVAAVSMTQQHSTTVEQNGARTVWSRSTHQRTLHVCWLRYQHT